MIHEIYTALRQPRDLWTYCDDTFILISSAQSSHTKAFSKWKLVLRTQTWKNIHGFLKTFGSHCFSSMLDFDAICRGRRYFCKSLLSSEVDFERYLWCSRALGHFIVCLRCLNLTLFVVAGCTFGSYCFSSMLDSDAICRGRRYFWKSLLAFDAWFWRYMWCSRALGHFIVCLRCLIFNIFLWF